jgi:hypothetical protein
MVLSTHTVFGMWFVLVKYPRTPHLPGSPGATNDDKVLSSLDCFKGKSLIVTVKMDGENTTMTKDKCYARSVDSRHHESRSWVKGLHAEVSHLIPSGWRICGENMYAKHSIYYEDLPAYFLVFSVWNSFNECLCWDATAEWCEKLKLCTVPVLYEDIDIGAAQTFAAKDPRLVGQEGFVIRNADAFHYNNFSSNVAKWVRANHVATDQHWMHSKLEANKLC